MKNTNKKKPTKRPCRVVSAGKRDLSQYLDRPGTIIIINQTPSKPHKTGKDK